MPSRELEFRSIDFQPAEIPAWRRSAAEDRLKTPGAAAVGVPLPHKGLLTS